MSRTETVVNQSVLDPSGVLDQQHPREARTSTKWNKLTQAPNIHCVCNSVLDKSHPLSLNATYWMTLNTLKERQMFPGRSDQAELEKAVLSWRLHLWNVRPVNPWTAVSQWPVKYMQRDLEILLWEDRAWNGSIYKGKKRASVETKLHGREQSTNPSAQVPF